MKKKILSLFLAIVMVITSVSAWPKNEEVEAASETAEEATKNTDTGYLELSFNSFGLDDGDITSNTIPSISWLKTFDKVAFSGKVTFPSAGTDNNGCIRIGGKSEAGAWSDAINMYRDANGHLQIVSGVGKVSERSYNVLGTMTKGTAGVETLDNQEIEIRLTFDYIADTTNVKVVCTITANDKTSVTESTIEDGQTNLARGDNGVCTLLIAPNGSMTIKSTEREYRELTFRDFGLADDSLVSEAVTSSLNPTYANVLDGVALNGYVVISPYNNTTLSIGGIVMRANGTETEATALVVRNVTDGKDKDLLTFFASDLNVDSLFYEKIEFRMTFDFDGNDIIIRCTYNGYGQTATIGGGATLLSTTITADSKDKYPITIQSTEKEYVEMTFGDFGIQNKKGVQLGSTKLVDSMDGVAVNGYITFHETADTTRVWIGGNDNSNDSKNGARIWLATDNNLHGFEGTIHPKRFGNTYLLGDGTYSIVNQKIKIRSCFDYIDNDGEGVANDVRVTTYFGEQFIEMTVQEDKADVITPQMHVAHANITVESIEKEFYDATFRDYGIEDQTVNGTLRSTTSPTETLDGVRLTGYLTFPENSSDANAIVRVGVKDDSTTGGVTLQRANNNFWFWNNTGSVETVDGTTGINIFGVLTPNKFDGVESGGNIAGDKMKFSIAFEYFGNNLRVTTVTYNIKEEALTTTTTVMKGCVSNLGNDIYIVSSGTNLTIGSVDIDRTYNEFTFRDFGWVDQSINGKNMNTTIPNVASLDGVAVTEYFVFPKNSETYFRIGGKTSEWAGLNIRCNAGGVFIISDGTGAGKGNLYELEDCDYSESWLKLRLTFDFTPTGNVVLGTTVNDMTTKYVVVEDYADYLGTKVLVCSTTTGNPLRFAAVKYNELTFRDWGLISQTVSGSMATSTVEPINSWDKVAVSGKLKFSNTNTDYEDSRMYVGVTGFNELYGIMVRPASTNRIAVLTGGWGSVPEGSSSYAQLPYEVDYSQELDIRLTFEYQDDGTILVGLTLNDSITSYLPLITPYDGVNNTETVSTNRIGYKICIVSSNDESVTFASATETKSVTDVTYNIEEKPYVLTSCNIVTVDGEEQKAGDTLTKAGDYTVYTNQNGILTERQVSLYIIGDVALSESWDAEKQGITLTDADVTELKAILAGEKEATPAQQKAADINNDGEVNNTDLKLLQDIVKADEPAKKRQEILDKYYVDALSFEYLGGDEVMPIAGYYGPDAEHLSANVFAAIKESGVNLINYSPIQNMSNPSAVLESLALAEKYGIGMFVNDANINPLQYSEDGTVITEPNTQLRTDAQVASLIGRYSYYDSYLGNFIVDEPTVAEQENDEITATNKRNYQYYTEISKQLNKYANTYGYLNLASGYWFKGHGTGGTLYDLSTDNIAEYESVVETITKATDAKALSFDRYLTDVDTIKSCARYMLNLDIIRSQAETSEIPFWTYVPTGGKWREETSGGKIPTEAEFYWQVNMSLAFGAKGIQYYTLLQTDEHANYLATLGEGYTGGILDADYHKNEGTWFTYAKNANKQISAVDEILMKSSNRGVVVSDGYAKANTTDITIVDSSASLSTTKKSLNALMTCNDIKSADGVSRVASIFGEEDNDYGVLTGVFDYQGKVALYVVNWDTTAEQDVTVTFSNLSNYRLIYAEDADTVVDSQTIGSSCTVTLGAGQAALIVIEEEDLATTTQHFDDIRQYRGTAFTAPELEGYVFAGWYTSEEAAGKDYAYVSGQTAASADEKSGAISATKKDGEAWAKYVDESILSVKGQLSTDVTAESDTARIRIVTSTNSLIYQDIGFDIETRGKTATAMGTKVFEKIKASTANGNLTFGYTPQESFDSHSYYFSTAILKVKAKDYLDEAITIKPFWTTADGTKVYGVIRSLTVNQGIQAKQANSGSVYSSR